MTTPAPSLSLLAEPGRAGALLRHPLRLRVMQALSEPASASDVASRLGLPRQRVNYHVGELRRLGLLRRAGRRQKRGFVEQRYVASARGYVLSPEILGALAARHGEVEDTASAAYQHSLLARSQGDLSRATRAASAQGKRLATLSITADVRFLSAQQRQAFTGALERALADVVAHFSAPTRREDGSDAPGRPFRLLVACHPIPKDEEQS